MPPLALSDSQLDAVLAAAAPLPVTARDQFLVDLAAALQGQDLGDSCAPRILLAMHLRGGVLSCGTRPIQNDSGLPQRLVARPPAGWQR
jgi:hypothetical protein